MLLHGSYRSFSVGRKAVTFISPNCPVGGYKAVCADESKLFFYQELLPRRTPVRMCVHKTISTIIVIFPLNLFIKLGVCVMTIYVYEHADSSFKSHDAFSQ